MGISVVHDTVTYSCDGTHGGHGVCAHACGGGYGDVDGVSGTIDVDSYSDDRATSFDGGVDDAGGVVLDAVAGCRMS